MYQKSSETDLRRATSTISVDRDSNDSQVRSTDTNRGSGFTSMAPFAGLGDLLDTEHTSDSDSVPRDSLLTQISVQVELEMTRHLPVWHCLWCLLQLQHLEVYALALVRDYHEWIQGTLHCSSCGRGRESVRIHSFPEVYILTKQQQHNHQQHNHP